MAYGADDGCAVMTYSGIKDLEDCQVIWTIFSKKKKKYRGVSSIPYERHD
jgi:hypothetical protein